MDRYIYLPTGRFLGGFGAVSGQMASVWICGCVYARGCAEGGKWEMYMIAGWIDDGWMSRQRQVKRREADILRGMELEWNVWYSGEVRLALKNRIKS